MFIQLKLLVIIDNNETKKTQSLDLENKIKYKKNQIKINKIRVNRVFNKVNLINEPCDDDDDNLK